MEETNSSSVIADDRMNPVNRNDHSTAVSDDDDDDDDDFKKGVKYLVDSHPPPGELRELPPEFCQPLPTINSFSVAHVDVPLIDLSGLAGPPQSKISTVKAISSACASWGFFRIVNHGIEVGLMEEMIKVVKDFFDMSSAEKMRYASDDVLSPVRYGTSHNNPKKHSLLWRDFLRHHGHPCHSYPDNPANYRIVAKEYLEQVWELAGKLGGAISEGLGLDPSYIEETLLGNGLQMIAANYFPACPEPDKTLGLPAHSDIGAITVVMDNGVDGLQVKHDGNWVAIRHVPATLVVNLGDCMEVLTNGKYKSVEHRATVSAEKMRISVAVAHGPHLSRWIAPANPLVDGGGSCRYPRMLYSEYVKMQQQQSSHTMSKSALEVIRTKKCMKSNY